MAKTIAQRQREILHQINLRRKQRFQGTKSPYKRLKKEVGEWCSKYIRLRDAVNREEGWGKCCDCGKVILIKYADAGHYVGRGSGGSSGVYFDERNIHLQAKQCNLSNQNRDGYRRFMLKKYGQKVIDELERLHRTHNYTLMELEGLKLYYKEAYEEMLKA